MDGEEGCLPISSIEKINPMNTCVKFKWIDPSISVGSGPPTMLQTVYYTRRKESQLQEHSEMVKMSMGKILGIG